MPLATSCSAPPVRFTTVVPVPLPASLRLLSWNVPALSLFAVIVPGESAWPVRNSNLLAAEPAGAAPRFQFVPVLHACVVPVPVVIHTKAGADCASVGTVPCVELREIRHAVAVGVGVVGGNAGVGRDFKISEAPLLDRQ